MIFDAITNRHLYFGLSPRIKSALEYLATTDFTLLPCGRYEIDKDNVFVLLQEYVSIPKAQGKWECHQKYIDIQYIAEGTEQIGISRSSSMEIIIDYNAEKDIKILNGHGDYITLTKGSFGIFFPDDAHQPKIELDGVSENVKKIVVKIKIE